MKTTRFLLAASILLAITFTLSCSAVDDAADKEEQLSSSSSSIAAEESIPLPSSSSIAAEDPIPLPSSSSIAAEDPIPLPSSSSIAAEQPLAPSSSSIAYPHITEIYLGCGYDVINSSYINRNDVKLTNPVLNIGKMYYEGIIHTDTTATEQRFETFTGTSLQEFYKSRNAGASVSYGGVLFSGKASVEFKTAKSGSTTASYARGRSYRYTRDDYIRGASPAALANYFAEAFVGELETKDATYILDKYGTHVLVRYYKGGSLEFNYTYSGSELNTSSKLTAAVKASYGFFSASASYQDSTSRKELESNSEFFYYTHGGKPLSSTEMSSLMAEYGTWINSINAYADIAGIADFNNSFVPLWDLARAGGYEDKAEELENEFEKRTLAQVKIFAKADAKVAKAEAKEAAKEAKAAAKAEK